MSISDRIAAVTRARPKPAAKKVKADERRWAGRKPGLMAGLIAYHPVKPPVDCLIRDMSATGAKLEVGGSWGDSFNSAQDVPDHITLLTAPGQGRGRLRGGLAAHEAARRALYRRHASLVA